MERCPIFILLAATAGFMLFGCGGNSSPDLFGGNGTPEIGLSDNTLDFGSSGLWRSLTITNTGGGTLSWFVQESPTWIDPSLSYGSLTAQASQTIVLELNRGLLNSGQNTDSLWLTSNGGDRYVTLLAQQVDSAVLGQLPDTLDFGSSLDSIALVIVNSGGAQLAYAISINDTLFSAFPTGGVTEDQDTVWVAFNRASAPSGIQEAEMTVESTGGVAVVHLAAFGVSANGVWLSYSGTGNGYYLAQPNDYFFLVRFDVVENWPNFKISRVRIQFYTIAATYDDIRLLCWSVYESGGFFYPGQTLHETDFLDPVSGWNEWEVDWTINLESFCVGYYQDDYYSPIYPLPYYDNTSPTLRSYLVYYDYIYNDLMTTIVDGWDWCIEVFVEPVSTAAGLTAPEGRWLRPSRIPVLPAPSPTQSSNRSERPSLLSGHSISYGATD